MSAGTILIVEDQAIVAEDLSRTVEDLGYDVAGVVASGTMAVAKVVQVKPDVVLMDIGLDGEKDGVMAAQVIGSRFKVPVVFVTAHSDKRTIERAKAAQPSGYVVKPFDAEKIGDAIQKALGRSEGESASRSSGTRSILLVDDHDHTQATMTAALPRGHRVKLTASLDIAKRALAGESFDLILMNIDLPDVGGGAAVRVLRKEMKVTTPIIAVTNAVTVELAAFVKGDVSALLESSELESRLEAEMIKTLRL